MSKEHPILFSAPMVCALLAGQKTQTRRAVKPVGNDGGFVLIENAGRLWPYRSDDGESGFHTVKRGGNEYLDETPHECPYGQPGDRLWVRENGWQRPERTPKMMREGADTWEPYYYDADGCSEQDRADFKRQEFKRRPSIHMPRWASRITLEIVNVRVERLQDISEADAIAEGTTPSIVGADLDHLRFRAGYQTLWEQINGAGTWAVNPWVWVVTFRTIKL